MSDSDLPEPAALPPYCEPTNIVIFGASGDLTKRKLLPALINMQRAGLLHSESVILGVVNNRTEEQWLNLVHEGMTEYAPELELSDAEWQDFRGRMHMVPGDLADDQTYQRLADSLQELRGRKNALFYCAIPPQWYTRTAEGLHAVGLTAQDEGYRRIVIEKPFGMNLASARALNAELQAVFDESQIYRIDHYLGKESVQNLLVFRFANSIMEPLWNRQYIDHVQISAAENIGIEYRANYYENAGALRDMIQSHLMQVMTLVAMEPPVELTADAVRDEKMKVLRAVRRFGEADIGSNTLGAQYAHGTVDDEQVPSYVAEQNVAPDSTTETFAGVRFHIDNWRWQGVPFILWSGKRLDKRVSEIVIRFRKLPFNLFDDGDSEPPLPNALVFRLQPDEGVFLRTNAKKPGLTTELQRLVMRAPYAPQGADVAEAYEILLHDVLQGDATLFSRGDEVEESWDIVEPILERWKDRVSIQRYTAGSWDVPGMEDLLAGCVGGWHKPS